MCCNQMCTVGRYIIQLYDIITRLARGDSDRVLHETKKEVLSQIYHYQFCSFRQKVFTIIRPDLKRFMPHEFYRFTYTHVMRRGRDCCFLSYETALNTQFIAESFRVAHMCFLDLLNLWTLALKK